MNKEIEYERLDLSRNMTLLEEISRSGTTIENEDALRTKYESLIQGVEKEFKESLTETQKYLGDSKDLIKKAYKKKRENLEKCLSSSVIAKELRKKISADLKDLENKQAENLISRLEERYSDISDRENYGGQIGTLRRINDMSRISMDNLEWLCVEKYLQDNVPKNQHDVFRNHLVSYMKLDGDYNKKIKDNKRILKRPVRFWDGSEFDLMIFLGYALTVATAVPIVYGVQKISRLSKWLSAKKKTKKWIENEQEALRCSTVYSLMHKEGKR